MKSAVNECTTQRFNYDVNLDQSIGRKKGWDLISSEPLSPEPASQTNGHFTDRYTSYGTSSNSYHQQQHHIQSVIHLRWKRQFNTYRFSQRDWSEVTADKLSIEVDSKKLLKF